MATTNLYTLRGSCSCGRNQYSINLPDNDVAAVNVMLDNSAASRRAHSAPLTAYIAVPLSYYRSATFAFYDDETHRDIRRVYEVPVTSSGQSHIRTTTKTTSPTSDAPTSTTVTTITSPSSPESYVTESQQRCFCGFCGTHFSTWSSSPHTPSSANYIRVSLESLAEDDFATLHRLGLLLDDSSDDEADEGDGDVEMEGSVASSTKRGVNVAHTGGGGREWFERMVGGSRVADLRGRGRVGEAYEEVEGSPVKRKRGEQEA